MRQLLLLYLFIVREMTLVCVRSLDLEDVSLLIFYDVCVIFFLASPSSTTLCLLIRNRAKES